MDITFAIISAAARKAPHITNNDINNFRDAVKTGATREQCLAQYGPVMAKYKWAYATIQKLYEPALQSQFNKDTFVEPLDFTVKKTIVLWGPPGVGKTQYALTHFEKPLLVTDWNDLKHLDSSYDGIIFDNMDFCRRSRLQCKLLVEHTAEAPIYYRHFVARIPQGMRRIFITTVRGGKIFGKHSDDGSIKWRTNFVCSNIPVREPTEQMKAAAAAYFGAEATAAKK